MISEDGVKLSAERAAKEDKRVMDEMMKAEKQSAENKQKRERQEAERSTKYTKSH